MRAKIVVFSGVLGGDGRNAVLDSESHSILDLAANPSVALSDLSLNEVPDTTRPKMISGHINLDNRVLTLVASETLDVTPADVKVDLGKIHLSNITNGKFHITCRFTCNSNRWHRN